MSRQQWPWIRPIQICSCGSDRAPLCLKQLWEIEDMPTVPLEEDKELSEPAAQVKACIPDHLMELRMMKFVSLAYCVYSSSDFALSYMDLIVR